MPLTASRLPGLPAGRLQLTAVLAAAFCTVRVRLLPPAATSVALAATLMGVATEEGACPPPPQAASARLSEVINKKR
ncbi:hypothetical protein GCM10011396_09690 [Undibacterium terreum]|uniref:Uncharacterized protein n=1 Tax=Undibacterium terreum TaxID=1224302 RepID=A0A916UA76_9BURK|nr:hypothetical protein GCM10011396_09690 [Undibacterium terreum]